MINFYNPLDNRTNEIASQKLSQPKYEPAEVVDIIYDEKHPLYEDENDLGSIIFRRLYSDWGKKYNELPRAKPYNTNIIIYPVRYETVLIIESTSTVSGTNDQYTTFYYIYPTNVWNLTNHNALPFQSISTQTQTQKDLTKYTGTNNEKSFGDFNGKREKIILGNYFFENISIPKLKPFEGDLIIQSRFGSSIRFSYNTNPNQGNFWSKDKKSTGNPIIIISNTKAKEKKFKLKVEDVNFEDSLIILTSGQKIDIKIMSKENVNFRGNSQTKIKDFDLNQIILNSDRLTLNSKKDSILGFANKSIGFSAKESVNLFSDKYIDIKSSDVYIDSQNLYLNTENKSQPAVLGNELLDVLVEMIQNLLTMTFNTAVGPTTPMNPPALTNFTNLLAKLQTLKPILSKNIFLN